MSKGVIINILVVGLGSAGLRHVDVFKQLGHTVEGIDADESACDGARAKFPGMPVHVGDIFNGTTARAIRRGATWNGAPCGAVVAVPPPSHVAVATACASEGFNVLIEKPLNAVELIRDKNFVFSVKKLQDILDRNNLIGMMAYNYRFNPGFLELKKILEAAEIINSVYSFYGHVAAYSETENIKNRVAIHQINYLRALFGEFLELDFGNNEYEFWAQGLTSQEARVFIYANTIDEKRSHYLTVDTDKGRFEWRDDFCNCWASDSDPPEIPHLPECHSRMTEHMINHFIECINMGTKPLTGIMDGLKDWQTLAKKQKLPSDEETDGVEYDDE